MIDHTPFVVSSTGKIHLRSCNVRGRCDALDFTDLEERVNRGSADPAQCCGASPSWWMEQRCPRWAAIGGL